MKMVDSVLLLLELFNDSEVEYNEILSKDNKLYMYMQRNLNRVCEFFKSTITLYFLDKFKSHFQMTRETCELFTRQLEEHVR